MDHYVPKERDWRLVYEWSNYRLCAASVNGAKGTRLVVDPFEVKAGWFVLDLDTALVRRGDDAPRKRHRRIDATLRILNLRQCVAQREEYLDLYRDNEFDLVHLERYAPFLELELQRQGALGRRRGKRARRR